LWHSRLPIVKEGNILRNRRSVCFAAEYDGLFYATALWSDPVAANRFDEGATMLELRRLAIADDAPKNTATRMIKIMVMLIRRKFPDVTRLVSYQDTEVHAGTIYKAAGWTQETVSTLNEWDKGSRKRSAAQSSAPKIRWGKRLA